MLKLKPQVIENAATIPLVLKTLYDKRVPRGTNMTLWVTMNALVVATQDLGTLEAENGACKMYDCANQDMYELIAEVILSGKLFEDWPVRTTLSCFRIPKTHRSYRVGFFASSR